MFSRASAAPLLDGQYRSCSIKLDLILPIRRKVDKLDHLSKLSKILSSILNLLQSVANGICLVDDLKDRISNRALMEQVVDLT